jgi:hypothetical protein
MTAACRRRIEAGVPYFLRNLRRRITFFIHLRFIAAFWAADIIPFGPNRYFLKPTMLFAYKLIDRHFKLPDANILLETSPIYIFGYFVGLL